MTTATTTRKPRKNARPANCIRCKEPMGLREDVKAGRATVAHAGKGLCGRCASRDRRGEPTFIRRPRPENCRVCGVPLRPWGSPKVEGTAEHKGNGLCSTHYQQEARAADALLESLGMV